MDPVARRSCSFARSGVVALGVAVATASCTGKDPFNPGTQVGTFHVTAKLTQTTCGSVPNPWEFDVRIRHDGSTLYWVQGGAPIQGRVDTAARAELEAEVVQEIRPADAKARKAACAIARTDVLTVNIVSSDGQPTLDPAQMTSFGGSLAYRFTPTAGSECDDQLAALGGDFAALPCEVHYDLSGAAMSLAQPSSTTQP